MATVQNLEISGLSTASSNRSYNTDADASDKFPVGLRVLVVDDDATCLMTLDNMLRKCSYIVTTCCRATLALSLLRERKGAFDVVISDVHMPDMDGFKLLEHVGLEMDLPVIMMSADQSTSAVMRGIEHGACDYLIKPVRLEQLKNIWQHVIRKKKNDNKDTEHLGIVEDTDRHKRMVDDLDYSSSIIEGTDGSWKSQKKRKDSKEEEDGESDGEDPSTSKKQRVVWSVELHQQFVNAVNQLGIDKAVPKRILELMNVPGLTRENVASHLQKFRLYLKRLSGVTQHQGGMPNSFGGTIDSNAKLGVLGRFDIQALTTTGQIPPQTLATLQAEILGRPAGSFIFPATEQSSLLQTSMQRSKLFPSDCSVSYNQPLLKCQTNPSKSFSHPNISMEESSRYSLWTPNQYGTVGSIGNIGNMNTTIPAQSMLQESSHPSNAQPSCIIVPSQSSTGFQTDESLDSCNQNKYSNFSLPSNASLSVGQFPVGSLDMLDAYSSGDKISPAQSSSVRGEIASVLQGANLSLNTSFPSRFPELVASPCVDMEPYLVKSGTMSYQEPGTGRNVGFIGRRTCIPSRLAVDDLVPLPESIIPNTCLSGERVKQEQNLDFLENSTLGDPVGQHYSANDLMSVISK